MKIWSSLRYMFLLLGLATFCFMCRFLAWWFWVWRNCWCTFCSSECCYRKTHLLMYNVLLFSQLLHCKVDFLGGWMSFKRNYLLALFLFFYVVFRMLCYNNLPHNVMDVWRRGIFRYPYRTMYTFFLWWKKGYCIFLLWNISKKW